MAGTESVRELVHRLETSEGVDQVGKPLASAVGNAVSNRTVKDALSGTWLGHPLHPMLTDLPIGSWTSAFVLDIVAGERGHDAAQALVGFGVLCALPTAAAGLSDWADTYGEEQRIGTVHAGANVAAVTLYSLSWLARRGGRRRLGVTLGFLGAAAATVGGYLGAHLVYRKGVGADRNAWKHGGDEWVEVADDVSLPAGEPQVVRVGDDDVLLVRTGLDVSAISNVCGHAGGPLDEGSFDEPGCVACPWHGSVFRLEDGHVVHGPATGHQPRYDVRSDGGKLFVRRARTTA
ncbi:MAG: Rieske 2Fe-2S domain-containing protein [Actinomycetota bacterium]|nr:Rieske 2Fe-2S domain-containing protein [Actinomycetota bacterium]